MESGKAQVFVQWDPPNIPLNVAGKLAKTLAEAGVTGFAVGGSVGAQGVLLDESVKIIKEETNIPVILFPGNVASVTERADAIYFMSMINSLEPYYITGAQTASSWPIKKMNLETIGTAYIVIEPGQAVGWVGRAKLVPRDQPYLAGITALASQYLGFQIVILEAGGGSPAHVPNEMIAFTRKLIDIPIVVAGGIKTPEHAQEVFKSGADVIHVGTAIEREKGDLEKVKKHISKLVKAGQKGIDERK